MTVPCLYFKENGHGGCTHAEIVPGLVEIEDGGSPRSGDGRLAALSRRKENHHVSNVSEVASWPQVSEVGEGDSSAG
jgi:hypothetical protein